MGLQKQVGLNQATGVVGDFATSNPYHTLVASVFQHRVGPDAGVLVGGFAEVDPSTGKTVQPLTGKNPIGFVGRASNIAVSTSWLQGASLALQKGQGVTLYDGGDFFVQVKGNLAAGAAVMCDTTGAISTSGTIATPFKVAVSSDESGLTLITKA